MAPPPIAKPPQQPAAPEPLFFDFGMIAHGKAGEHDFVLDSRQAIGADYYPVGTQLECSCARAKLLCRNAAGIERELAGPGPESQPQNGEVVVVRLLVDTSKKEPVDLPPVDSNAVVYFQQLGARDGSTRVPWRLRVRYGIDSPVRVRPFAVLDFERVPRSQPKTLATTLASDIAGRRIRFGPARCDDPRVQLQLEERGEFTYLHATLTPRGDDDGNLRVLVTVDTDLDDKYCVNLAAIAQFVPDLVATPIDKISLRADLRHEQSADRAQSQYVVVTDHDTRRPPEFVVARFVDAAGHDATADFEVRLEPVNGDPRSSRLHLRWIGHRESEFRGQIVLAKDAANGPFLPIEVVALHAPPP